MTLQMDLPTLDDYPTRKSTEAALLYRRDPTVWGTAEEGPFTDSELQDHDRRGYTRLESLVGDAEVLDHRDELDRLVRDPGLREDERALVDPADGGIRSVFEVHRVSEAFEALVNDPRLVERARQILGSEVYVHQSRVDHRPGFGGGPLYWRSDFETWHAEDGMPRMRAVGFSVALTDEHSHNGALMVMPGSHRTYVSCLEPAEEDGHERAGTPDRGALTILAGRHGIDVLSAEAGDVTVFDSNCMYGAGANITPFARSNLFVVYNSVENVCEKPFSAAEPRPGFLASRDFTPAGG
ncbi:ectoine hydroxylase [Nocardiopsis lambiniae]|uniref:Ectoine hydroxylase n=1 Tax=Nocardiopsis lambiniae TaxID=3075539 RepID=A0ABU2M5P6_9ACTN|nr:ectoine hydroxylase [Nocardiopsis sp. DSM 44743]MDT0327894.1 ectoine hydroxylase [Nocardiopsis sp. DSM 44743]